MLFSVSRRYQWEDFVLDLDAYRLERSGVPIAIEPKAFNLLALFLSRPGQLLTKQEIFDTVWPGTAVTDHALTRVVAQLRKALGDEAREARYLETVPTRGYRWIAPSGPPRSPGAAPPGPEPGPNPGGAADSRRRWPSPRVALVVAIGALAAAALLWGRRPPDAGDQAPVARPVQLTTHAGLDLHPVWSPSGDALAFVSDRSGAFEIYVRALSGAATDVPLTSDGGQNVQPTWSPDGRLIAFHSYRRGGIWVVPARGGTPSQIVPEGSKPAWSPDGRLIAFQSDEHADAAPVGFGAQAGSRLLVVAPDGSGLRALTSPGTPLGGHASPSWSPSGRHIAFTVFDSGGENGLWLLDVSSGAATQLAPERRLFESVFAPDGTAIYVAAGDARIVRIPLDPAGGRPAGTADTIPVAGVPGVRGLSMSPDGRRLAFAGVTLDSQIWSQPVDAAGRAIGAPRALMDDTSQRNSLPVVSPDGARVAYMSARQGEAPNVWLMNADGTQPVQLTSDEAPDLQPTWLPDGRRVAFQSQRRGIGGIWAVDTATRREELLFDGRRAPFESLPDGVVAEFVLAPSATLAAVSLLVRPEANRVVFTTPFPRMVPRAVSTRRQSIGYPAWSPDERTLAVEIKAGSSTHAGLVDVATGAVRQLTSDRGQTWVRSWSPDGRRIAAAALRAGAWSLVSIDAASGQTLAMTPPELPRVYVRYPAWSPRGTVLYERAEMLGNIWTLATL